MQRLISMIIIFGIAFCGCNTKNQDMLIAEQLEIYDALSKVGGLDNYSETSTTDFSNVEGIISSGFTINDNKYYFVTKRKNAAGYGSNKMITYYDFETGDSHGLCRDPLCEHEQGGKCKYSGFKEVYFSDNSNVFYSIYMYADDFRPIICKIDLLKDTVTGVYTCPDYSVSMIGKDGNKLYFYVQEDSTENGITKRKEHLFYVDMNTDNVVDLGYFSEVFTVEHALILFVYENQLYYTTVDDRLMKMHLDSEQCTELYNIGANELLYWFYDTKTDELYFNLNDLVQMTGAVYVYRNGVTEQLSLPHENIFTFTLTNSNIYYSPYDPVYYGISKAPGNPQVFDYTGGKVYKTDRKNPVGSELVYDCAGEYVICGAVSNYYVFGEHLYFDQKEVKHETIDGIEYTYFSSAYNVSKMRVDLNTGEMTELQFD